jgi:hypothetical protein
VSTYAVALQPLALHRHGIKHAAPRHTRRQALEVCQRTALPVSICTFVLVKQVLL